MHKRVELKPADTLNKSFCKYAKYDVFTQKQIVRITFFFLSIYFKFWTK